MPGKLVISLDFELLWGVRDHADKLSYGKNVLGARAAVPKILELFAANGIRATWATVGFLFCENKDELIASLPQEQPKYSNRSLSSYEYIKEVGHDEVEDPYYFAPSLIDQIAKTPGQEIATHTLSHYYCLEDGQNASAFEADLVAAKQIAQRRGINIRSIVFPRNQYAREHLNICKRQGIITYRGNPNSWAYRAAPGAAQTPLRRAVRLADAYTGYLGSQLFTPDFNELTNVPASRFLRPSPNRLTGFHALHIETIKRGITTAARSGSGYHLWWHPHNFGRNFEENFEGLKLIIAAYIQASQEEGMQSCSMVDMACV